MRSGKTDRGPGGALRTTALLLAAAASGCWSMQSIAIPGEADTDSVTDTDSETETDTDSETETGSETGPMPHSVFTGISAGWFFNCALRDDGAVICWGSDFQGQSDPPPGPFTRVTCGASHSCGLRPSGEVECWGEAEYFQGAPDQLFKWIDAGWRHTCGIKVNGKIRCWGKYPEEGDEPPGGEYTMMSGRLERFYAIDTESCLRVWQVDYPPGKPGGSCDCVQVSCGTECCCALREGGVTECGGHCSEGPAGIPFQRVSAGNSHACGVDAEGGVRCWGGFNEYGQLDAPAGEFVDVATGVRHSCALDVEGAIVCWGSNDHGQLEAPL